MGKIFYLMGKSSSGKDTLYRGLRSEIPQLKPVVTYTTRPMREGEKEGEEYHFIDEQTVEQLKAEGRVIELRSYDTVHGLWRYLTVDDGNVELETNHYLMIGTLESYAQVRNYFGPDKVVPLYVVVDDGERLIRAVRREQMQGNPKYEELCRRFLADQKDFSEEKLAEVGITHHFRNVSRNKCMKKLSEYVRREMEADEE